MTNSKPTKTNCPNCQSDNKGVAVTVNNTCPDCGRTLDKNLRGIDEPTKPNNEWEIKYEELLADFGNKYLGYNEYGTTTQELDTAENNLKDFISKTLQQQREENKDNLLNISMMIETVLGYLEMGNIKQAIKHLEVTQSMCYSDEENKLLQSLKEKK